ncbi:MAG: hypothetical protein AAGC55_29750, partial [Myxococcota bacterium]
MHPQVAGFFKMSLPRLISRYCHLHPYANRRILSEILTTEPHYLRWSGSDNFNVSTETGIKQKMI